MSRFWAEPQRLLIEPDALVVVGSGGSARRIAFDAAPDLALAAFAGESADLVRRGSRWQVSIADALVRYLVVRWPDGLRGRGERVAFVAHRFREVHGVVAPEWQIAVERTATRLPALACAAPAVLVAAIGDWARRNRVRLVGASGEFIATYNRVRPALAHPLGALAVQRAGRVTVGLWHDAVWHALRSQPLGSGGDAGLALFLESMRVGAGASGEGVMYCAGTGFDAPPGWRTVRLGDAAWA